MDAQLDASRRRAETRSAGLKDLVSNEFHPCLDLTTPEGKALLARCRAQLEAEGAGSLVLFRGRYSLHRVTPVEGSRPRLVAVLSYDTEPGVMLSEYNRRLFYGRAN